MTCGAQAVLGEALTVLAPNQADVIDAICSLEVELANDRLWLEGRDDAALRQGANLAMLGREVIQFGQVTATGPRRFRLSRLLRGRFGSEWAMAGHVEGEAFVLLDPTSLTTINIPDALLGTLATATSFGIGDGEGTSVIATATGEALRPPSPVHLRATWCGGDLSVSWVRRSRLGYAWVDDIDAPLGEMSERYRVRIESGTNVIERDAVMPVATLTASELAALGGGPAMVTVCQVGDRALSRWNSLPIILP